MAKRPERRVEKDSNIDRWCKFRPSVGYEIFVDLIFAVLVLSSFVVKLVFRSLADNRRLLIDSLPLLPETSRLNKYE